MIRKNFFLGRDLVKEWTYFNRDLEAYFNCIIPKKNKFIRKETSSIEDSLHNLCQDMGIKT